MIQQISTKLGVPRELQQTNVSYSNSLVGLNTRPETLKEKCLNMVRTRQLTGNGHVVLPRNETRSCWTVEKRSSRGSGLWHIILFYFVLWVEETVSKLHEPEVIQRFLLPSQTFDATIFDEFAFLGRFGRVSGRGTLDGDVCRCHARRGMLLNS